MIPMFKNRNKNRIGEVTMDLLTTLTGLKQPDQAVAKLIRMYQLANEEANALGDRLCEMQTRVEVAQADLDRRQLAMEQHLRELAEVSGVHLDECTEEKVMASLRKLRVLAEQMNTIHEVQAGRFSPDNELVRRVACAVGTSSFDLKELLALLGKAAGYRGQVANLSSKLDGKDAQIEALRRTIDELENPDDLDD